MKPRQPTDAIGKVPIPGRPTCTIRELPRDPSGQEGSSPFPQTRCTEPTEIWTPSSPLQTASAPTPRACRAGAPSVSAGLPRSGSGPPARPLLVDGGMGTLLFSRGVPQRACLEELVATHPELVGTAHREYIEAGAELIETLSFGANRIATRGLGPQGRVGPAQPACGPARPRGARGERAGRARRRFRRTARFAGARPDRTSPTPRCAPRSGSRSTACSKAASTSSFSRPSRISTSSCSRSAEARAAADLPVIASLTFGEELVLADGSSPRKWPSGRCPRPALTRSGSTAGPGRRHRLDALEAMGRPVEGEPRALDHAERRSLAAARGPVRLRRERRVLRDGDAARCWPPARGSSAAAAARRRITSPRCEPRSTRSRRPIPGWPGRAAVAGRRPSSRAPARSASAVVGRRASDRATDDGAPQADPPGRAPRGRAFRRLGRDRPAPEHQDRADHRGRPAPARRRRRPRQHLRLGDGPSADERAVGRIRDPA